ncbi:hypothetical protein [Halocatena pleomorpha]|uniref:Glutamate--cysteine ligase n=1 Tax=Halocatena pleomorpha TaxID=1785090 RepID=A0A3P3R4Q5_9EURY|nr:hypothetical protein [Halocatena pleomorpha]RRJ28325.1 hypothetical protein EIK79_15890 [Halocatena pleomorpha]
MSTPDLADRVAELLSVDHDEFIARVERETEWLKGEIRDGTFDNPQGIVGLEYEFYGVDDETDALKRVPRRLLDYIGFEKELGLHNAEMQTTPQPLSTYGLAAQEAEVQARLDAALRETKSSGIRLVSDGMWTIPPVGESATGYLTGSVVDNDIRIATNMSGSERYHAMANVEFGAELSLDAPHVTVSADTVMSESLITSVQPHYQVSHAPDLPTYFQYALRIAGPLLALGVNSPFFPPELYDDDVDIQTILDDGWMENRIPVFESILNPPQQPKVCFPEDIDSVETAIDRIVDDRTVVPMLFDGSDRFGDQFAHFRHKHGTYWRWVRPVFDGPTKSHANARIEFRPLPGQPTVRDVICLQAMYAGLLESLAKREHPVKQLSWDASEENFYTAAQDGLSGSFQWLTADGVETTDKAIIYEELFDYARDGLSLRGLTRREIDRYIAPLEERYQKGVTPARWKHDRVRNAVDSGTPFVEAVWEMQTEYIERQEQTLIEGRFVDWL